MKRMIAFMMLLVALAPAHSWAQPGGTRDPITGVRRNPDVIAPALPEWCWKLPTSDSYFYYRGEGVDTDLERAKVKARSDAFKKIQMATSPGASDALVEQVKLTESSETLKSESSVAFAPANFPGLDVVADYDAIVPIDGQAAHRYFILMRIPRPKSGVASRIGRGITGRADAVFHSAIFPGWGQVRQGRTGEGAFFALTGTLTGMAAGTFYALEKEDFKHRAKDWKSYRRGSLYAFGGIYAANLVSALVGGHRAHEFRAVEFGLTWIAVHFK